MKKIVALLMACVFSGALANANENEMAAVDRPDSIVRPIGTDQEILEHHKPLLPPPANTDKKDLAYWAGSVASRIKVTGYAQGGYTAKFVKEDANSNTFDLKRVVLMVGAEVAPKFHAFFMHEFKSGAVQEYYLEYRPFTGMNFRLGQSKIELSLENPLSPTILESISPMSQGVFWLCGADPLMGNPSGRDLGLMMYGELFNHKVKYVIEVVNGGQINTTDKNNQKNVIGKLEYRFTPGFKIVASGQKGYGYSVATSKYNNIAEGETYRQDRYTAGFDYKFKPTGNDFFNRRCAMIRSEVLGGRDGDVGSFGAYASTAVPVYKGLDIVGLVDYFNYNTDRGLKKTNLMIGAQYWIFKKCRLQLQYTHSLLSKELRKVEGVKGNYGQLQTQVQVAF
jgi:hypothetical protein